jgi:endogenous inhibitor of DNA gyrase (YacG/DUF329 family)
MNTNYPPDYLPSETDPFVCERCEGTGLIHSEQDQSDLLLMRSLLGSVNLSTSFRLALQKEILDTSPEEPCPDCRKGVTREP